MKKVISFLTAVLLINSNFIFVNAEDKVENESNAAEDVITSWDCQVNEIYSVYDDDGNYLGKNVTVVYRTDPEEKFKMLHFDDAIAEILFINNYEVLLEEKLGIINGETVYEGSGWYNLIQKCKDKLLPVENYPGRPSGDFDWLPIDDAEFKVYSSKNDPVAIVNGYIVMSKDFRKYGFYYLETQDGTASCSLAKYHSACDPVMTDPGGPYNPMLLYKADSPGDVVMSFKIFPGFFYEISDFHEYEIYWESTNYFHISEDLEIKEITAEEYLENNNLERGDINGDGVRDVTDLVELALVLIGDNQLTETQKLTADVDENGKVHIADLATLHQILLQKNTFQDF